MAFEDAETTVEGTPEGTGETEGTTETPQAAEETSSTQSSEQSAESSAPSVDWSTIDAEELYKHRPEFKPKTAEDFKDELLSSDDVKRQIQSEKDKEIAKEKRRLITEAKRRDKDEADRKVRLDRQRLLDEEDYEGLGQLMAQEQRNSQELLRSADVFMETGEDWIRDNPEYRVLGDDRVNEIIDSVKNRSGASFYEIQLELAKALSTAKADEVRVETEKSITERVNEAVEAALAAAGVQQRSENAEKGEAAVESVASGGGTRISGEKMDYNKSADLYNAGLRTWTEHKPFFDAHQKGRYN